MKVFVLVSAALFRLDSWATLQYSWFSCSTSSEKGDFPWFSIAIYDHLKSLPVAGDPCPPWPSESASGIVRGSHAWWCTCLDVGTPQSKAGPKYDEIYGWSLQQPIWKAGLFRLNQSAWMPGHIVCWNLHSSLGGQLCSSSLAQVHVRHAGVGTLCPGICRRFWIQVQSPSCKEANSLRSQQVSITGLISTGLPEILNLIEFTDKRCSWKNTKNPSASSGKQCLVSSKGFPNRSVIHAEDGGKSILLPTTYHP